MMYNPFLSALHEHNEIELVIGLHIVVEYIKKEDLKMKNLLNGTDSFMLAIICYVFSMWRC